MKSVDIVQYDMQYVQFGQALSVVKSPNTTVHHLTCEVDFNMCLC